MIDFKSINASLLARSRDFLADLFPAGKVVGHEFQVGNIHGEAGSSLSINLNTGVGADFASGDTFSDLIAVYAAHHGLSMGDAAKRLSNGAGEAYRAPAPAPARSDKPQGKQAIIPVPAEAPPPPRQLGFKVGEDWHDYPVVAKWAYTTADGGLIGYVCRVEPPGGKEIIPIVYAADKNGRERWQQGAFPKPRPLYNLEAVAADPTRKVIVVEGEKCVDWLRARGSGRVATTWPGGSNAVKHADWEPLRGRDVLLIPDHDSAGYRAVAELAEILLKLGCVVTVIDHRDQDLPDGWDVADTTWTLAELNAWAKPLAKPVTRPPENVEKSGADIQAAARRGRPRSRPDGAPPNGTQIEADGSAFVSWSQMGLQCNGNGSPFPNLANVQQVLTRHPDLAGKIWYDEFHGCAFSTFFSAEPEPWEDHHDTDLTIWMQGALRLQKMGVNVVQRAVDAVARHDVRNEPRQWMQSLKWDGCERLATVMSDGFGAAQNDYTAAVGLCFFTGMVARVFDPGCKHDYMPVFEGYQGRGKSGALDVIGGKWFAEQHEDITKKDFFQNLRGKMLFEISEMHAFKRAEVERIKGVVSCRRDRYRESYGRRAGDHPRMCGFAGTTNRDDWVADDTGARRFWPIACADINVDYLRQVRDQLFAEAVARFHRVPLGTLPGDRVAAAADWWSVDPDLAKAEVEARRDDDVWTEAVLGFARTLPWVRVADVMQQALGIAVERHARTDQMRVASILRIAGFWRGQRRDGDRVFKIWTNPKAKSAAAEQTELL